MDETETATVMEEWNEAWDEFLNWVIETYGNGV